MSQRNQFWCQSVCSFTLLSEWIYFPSFFYLYFFLFCYLPFLLTWRLHLLLPATQYHFWFLDFWQSKIWFFNNILKAKLSQSSPQLIRIFLMGNHKTLLIESWQGICNGIEDDKVVREMKKLREMSKQVMRSHLKSEKNKIRWTIG